MSKELKDVLAEYEAAMNEAIPQMVADVKRREQLANLARLGLLPLHKRVAKLESALGTEQTMHAAWRKRAEESESELSALKEENAQLRKQSDHRLCIIENLMSVFHDPSTCQCVYHEDARELLKDSP